MNRLLNRLQQGNYLLATVLLLCSATLLYRASQDMRGGGQQAHTAVAHLGTRLSQRQASFIDSYKDSTNSRRTLRNVIRSIARPPHTLAQNYIKLGNPFRETPQSREVARLTRNKKGGVFVECGANDGEHSSNSLPLEHKLGWTGLLIEMDPYFYTQIVGKRRKTWNLNACLSPTNKPYRTRIEESIGGMGRIHKGAAPRNLKLSPFTVPCFPLTEVLVALNMTRVDYLSLDVEGLEYDVIKTIDFRRVHINILSVEYAHNRVKHSEIISFMKYKKYRFVKKIVYHNDRQALHVEDFVFQKL